MKNNIGEIQYQLEEKRLWAFMTGNFLIIAYLTTKIHNSPAAESSFSTILRTFFEIK
jgi:hypothetical protein